MDGSVLAFLNCLDGSILAFLKCMDGSVLAFLKYTDTVKKIGHPGTSDLLYSFEEGPTSKVYKTPSKGEPCLVTVMVHTVAVGHLKAV